MFSMAMWMATVVAPLQLLADDLHGLNTLEHQPAKIAAMEGHFETQEGALISIAVIIYILLDGFDLGIGIVFPLLGGEDHQNVAMNSVAPVWDGNETWLILGGGGLYAVFPLAYAIILPAFYAPIIAMLLGLVLHGAADSSGLIPSPSSNDGARQITRWTYGSVQWIGQEL
jgi:cytochrome bd-type quinol oxidase subunit 1